MNKEVERNTAVFGLVNSLKDKIDEKSISEIVFLGQIIQNDTASVKKSFCLMVNEMGDPRIMELFKKFTEDIYAEISKDKTYIHSCRGKCGSAYCNEYGCIVDVYKINKPA